MSGKERVCKSCKISKPFSEFNFRARFCKNCDATGYEEKKLKMREYWHSKNLPPYDRCVVCNERKAQGLETCRRKSCIDEINMIQRFVRMPRPKGLGSCTVSARSVTKYSLSINFGG